MNISYKRDMTHNYMVPEMPEAVREEDYRVHMLMENHIQGLLPCVLKRINGQGRFYYDITSRQSMERIYGNNRMCAKDIAVLLRGLYGALKEIKKYLLEEDQIVLEPGMIYMDIETQEPLFCYLPGYQKDIVQSFRELSAYLLEHLDRTDSRAVLLGFEIYQKAREENYSLGKILQEAEQYLIAQDGAAEAENFYSAPPENGREPVPYVWRRETETPKNGNRQANRAGQVREKLPQESVDWQRENWQADRAGQGKKKIQQESAGRQWENMEFQEEWQDDIGYAEQKEPERAAGHQKKQKQTKKKKADQKKIEKQEKPAKAERQDHAKTGHISGRVFLILCFVMAVLLLLAAAWFWNLNVTQTGGIVFLLAGILIYGFSMEGKSAKAKEKKDKKESERILETFQEEPYYEEPGYGRNGGYEAETYKRERGMGEEVYGKERGMAEMGHGRHPYEEDWRFENRDFRQSEHLAERTRYENDSYGMAAEEIAEKTRRADHAARLGNTGVLYEDSDFEQHLVLVNRNPKQKDSIILEEESYIVGKLASRCDIVIDHPSVSRVHAKLERQGKMYFLCDLNSTNGTFLNGKRLMVNERVVIHPGDEIAFAKEGYYVRRC